MPHGVGDAAKTPASCEALHCLIFADRLNKKGPGGSPKCPFNLFFGTGDLNIWVL